MHNAAFPSTLAAGSAHPAVMAAGLPAAIGRRTTLSWIRLPVLVLTMSLAACSTTPTTSTRPGRPVEPTTAEGGDRVTAPPMRPSPSATPPAPATATRPDSPGPTSRRGGYYMDDGPGESPPPDLAAIPNAQPRREALSSRANRPYVVFGRSYQPMTVLQPYRQRGHASWYGRKFHGQKTSNGEIYDMYAMTAAHPTLPIPSFARVTNVANGEQVIVRINDRGPFLQGRIIDLSYTAASKLGYIRAGSAEVDVELLHQLDPDPLEQVAASRTTGRPLSAAPVAESAAAPVVAPLARDTGDERLVVETTLVAEPSAVPAMPALTQLSSNPSAGASLIPAASTSAGTAAAAPQSTAVSVPAAPSLPASPSAAAAAAAAPSSAISSAKPAQAYLQLGAFSSRENAEVIRNRLTTQLDWLRQPLEIVGDGRLFRLVTGPFVTRDDSTAAAQRIQRSTGTLPFTTLR